MLEAPTAETAGRRAIEMDSRVHPRAESDADRAARIRSLVDQHFDFVWRSLRRLGVPRGVVDDAAQEVFWIAARKLDRIEPGRERSYLFSTATRVASDARRRHARKREVQDERLVEAIADLRGDPEALVDQKRARDLLDVVLQTMPFDLRTVLVLADAEELTMAEIADLLGIPAGTVASRLRRARHLFQACVDDLLVTSDGSGEGA